jgi:hypothetical protein
MLSPILEKMATDPAIKSGTGLPLDLVTVNTDEPDGFELGQKYKVCLITQWLWVGWSVNSYILGPCATYCNRFPVREPSRQFRWGIERGGCAEVLGKGVIAIDLEY